MSENTLNDETAHETLKLSETNESIQVKESLENLLDEIVKISTDSSERLFEYRLESKSIEKPVSENGIFDSMLKGNDELNVDQIESTNIIESPMDVLECVENFDAPIISKEELSAFQATIPEGKFYFGLKMDYFCFLPTIQLFQMFLQTRVK